ncbi:MAG: siroheme synthase CysG [Gammaproteobacteria bacterium]|nr:siroheme synthase CysG [Gammaproteobacteria bacterium]
MDYFPLFADLKGRPCLVVGGGSVALRKVRQLSRAGARVTVNAPGLCAGLQALLEDGRIHHVAREFDPTLLADALIVVAATDDHAVNERVAELCRAQHKLCNVVDNGSASGFIMPSTVDRSPIVIAVSSGGQAPLLARVIRQRIDDWLPGRIAQLARWVAHWRDRVNQRFATHNERVAFWQRLLDGPAADKLLAGKTREADAQLAAALATDHGAITGGEAWLVGAGPGDPELLTRRGLYLLQRADAVLYDALVAPEIVDLARRDAELICVGKRGGQPSTSQADINTELVNRVTAGQRVCRLKGGDPFVFGRGGEELQALAQAGLPYQVVPGITAATGCAAYAGIPLTHRALADGVSFVTGHRADDQPEPDWASLARNGQTLVVYMATRQLGRVCAALRDGGRPAGTPAALISRGTTAEQQVVGGNLDNLASRAATARTPAVLIVGDVAGLMDELRWFGESAGSAESAAV